MVQSTALPSPLTPGLMAILERVSAPDPEPLLDALDGALIDAGEALGELTGGGLKPAERRNLLEEVSAEIQNARQALEDLRDMLDGAR